MESERHLPDDHQQEQPACNPRREGSYILTKENISNVYDATQKGNRPGSAACVASSISTVLNFNLLSLGSPDPTQVQQITSAAPKISFSHCRINVLYFLSSFELSSPCSFFSWISFCSSTCV